MTEVPYFPLAVDPVDVRYAHGPDSAAQEGVPRGSIAQFEWADSAVYPGTTRNVSVYVPAQYEPTEPASLVVFQDGQFYLDPAGEIRAGIVLDNLIQRGDIPVTIGVFVDPGRFESGVGADVPADRVGTDVPADGVGTDVPAEGACPEVPAGGADPTPRKNRNVEYDAFDDRYVTFLLDEILPAVAGRWSITDDHSQWAICGGSSGGNCAFTAAWLRPDAFRCVICFLSSFVQMPTGNPYPALIADTPRQPLRVFMQAGHRDLNWDEREANWFASNLHVAAALAEAGYDFRLVLGDGGHSPNHGGVLLPDALRWAFR